MPAKKGAIVGSGFSGLSPAACLAKEATMSPALKRPTSQADVPVALHPTASRSTWARFRNDTMTAIDEKISLNPVLNSFQAAVHQYDIDINLVDVFLKSMETDLTQTSHDQHSFETYVLGPAEVAGLMCLQVFCLCNKELSDHLKPYATKLGAAFQKINLLRDINTDYKYLGRIYFPGLDVETFDDGSKKKIERSIREDLAAGLEGIRRLPASSKLGVYVAYLYYLALFKKIANASPGIVMKERISIRNHHKLSILCYSYLKHQFNLI